MGWFLDSLSTILVVFVLIFVVGLAIRSIIKDRKKGRCSCGCEGCSGCIAKSERKSEIVSENEYE